jgi:hypothetical protein
MDRVRGRIERTKDGPPSPESVGVVADEHWERHAHEIIGQPWPCIEAGKFGMVWDALSSSLNSGLALGAGHDADPALARAIWCLVRHLEPERIVETGVARGIVTSSVLHALEANGRGHLWSIDLPPLLPDWHAASGAAVPSALKARWTFLRGSSRRHLPRLLKGLGEIDIFIHDSLHTAKNMRFEFQCAWPVIRPGGVLVADDAAANLSFVHFANGRGSRFLVAQEELKPSKFGIAFQTRNL